MSDEKSHNGWSKLAITAIITFLLSSGFWNVLQQYTNNDKVTRGEVHTIMQQSSPYMTDRSMILKSLTDLQKGQEEMSKKIDDMRVEIRAERRGR